MEKRISFFQFQSVKAVAKAIDPKLREITALHKKALVLKEEIEAKRGKLQKEIDEKTAKLKSEFDACEAQINALEAGIVQTLGFRVNDLVKKVIEPTGKTDPKTGKPIKITKYLPTDIVSYDEQTKEYVITVQEEEVPTEDTNTTSEQSPIVPPTTENGPGSDFDKDVEQTQSECPAYEEEEEEAIEESQEDDNFLESETPDNDLPF